MKKNKVEKVLFKSLILSFLFFLSSNLNAVINDILIFVGNDFSRITEIAENLKKGDAQEDWVIEKFDKEESNIESLNSLWDDMNFVFLCSMKNVPFLDNWLKTIFNDKRYLHNNVLWVFLSNNYMFKDYYFRGSHITLTQNIKEFDMIFGKEVLASQCVNDIKETLNFWRSCRNIY